MNQHTTTAGTTPSRAEAHASHHAHQPHVTPIWTLLAVFAALLALTFVTVAVVDIQLGPFNIWVAMGVATAKATLVALYFMHLRYDNKFNLVIFLICFLFVTLFVGIAMLDTREYQPEIRELGQSSTAQR